MRVQFILPSAADALSMIEEAFGAFRAVLADLDQNARTQAWGEIGSYLKQFETETGLTAELYFLTASGANS